MGDQDKTKEQLVRELQELRDRLAEARSAEAHLGQAVEEYRKKVGILFEAAPVGIGVADLEGNIVDANPCMAELTGYTVEELRRTRLEDTYVNPEDRELLLDALGEPPEPIPKEQMALPLEPQPLIEVFRDEETEGVT